MRGISTTCRERIGSSQVELPFLLFILFVLFVFPLVDLATIGLRYSNVFYSAREGARAAGRSRTFLVDGADGPSATNNAKQVAVTASMFGAKSSFTPNDVTVFIVGTPIKGGLTPIRQQTPLAVSAPQDYVYQIEVNVAGTVEPLVYLDRKIFGDVPGLTVPMVVNANSSEFVEFPQGMIQ